MLVQTKKEGEGVGANISFLLEYEMEVLNFGNRCLKIQYGSVFCIHHHSNINNNHHQHM